MRTSRRTVVVAIDDKQPTVLAFAAAEARRRGALLRVVHVAGVPGRQTATFVLGEAAMHELAAAGRKVLDDALVLVQDLPDAPEIELALLGGPLLGTLVAESAKAQCLVIGADRQAWVDRLASVAIAGFMAEHADCPVVVVPERAYPGVLEGGVVVALDGDTDAAGPLTFAFERARECGGVLHVLHAGTPLGRPAKAAAHLTNIAEVLAGWSSENPDVRVVSRFADDEADVACDRATESAEILVLGRSNERHVPLVSRPVIRRVLRSAHCPVAVVPLSVPVA